MDPDTCLDEIRDLAGRILADQDAANSDPENVLEAEDVAGLAERVLKRGALPQEWKQ